MSRLALLIKSLAHGIWYWLACILFGVSLLAVALYYQYALEELPCVMCIQVRLWVSLFIVISIVMLFLFRYRGWNSLGHALMIPIAAGLCERSYQLLGTERGFIVGDCVFDLGLPQWMAFQEWFPAIFKVETSCGYTPLLPFGVTMAEGLMVISVLMLLASLIMTVASLTRAD